MNEFEEKDYQEARGLADSIKGNADNINDIFTNIDHIMNELYGDNWQSSGAEQAKARYDEIRKNYEVFYQKVTDMKTHIYNVTAANEDADAVASSTITHI